LSKEICPIRSGLVAELTTESSELAKIVERLKVLNSDENRANGSRNEEIIELNSRRNKATLKCGQLLQKIGAHRAEHDC
jgi:hypothetical protein